ncbi:MAG TPA: hypothetical protein VM219_04020 [Phycisphaerae bacterium]|nr:hypothetical protein [Phycisphaerae bacterium]
MTTEERLEKVERELAEMKAGGAGIPRTLSERKPKPAPPDRA